VSGDPQFGTRYASGAGGLFPRVLCGRLRLYCCLHRSTRTCASCRGQKISRFSSSSRSLPLKLSMFPFSQGLPGSMNSVRAPNCPSQRRILWHVKPGPLSERMCSGIPREQKSSVRHSCTSSAVSLLPTRIARHSRVNSSITLKGADCLLRQANRPGDLALPSRQAGRHPPRGSGVHRWWGLRPEAIDGGRIADTRQPDWR
jgi:hypothetical protein